MRWGKVAAAGGAALGAAALYNAAAAAAVQPLDNRLGGEPGEILWRGHRVAYSQHGSGTPVLLVHGLHAGASSFEWRHTVAALAERHTVIALDLLGYGCSDRPDLRYTPALYQALIADTLARVARGRCAVVASSLGAAQVIALAARDSRHIGAMAMIAPTGMARVRVASGSYSPTQLLLDAPVVGTTIYNGITSAATMRGYLEQAYANDRLVTDALVQEYVQSARQPGGKHAVGAFLAGRVDVDVHAALRRVRQPLLLVWGEQARHNPVQHAHAFRVIRPDAEWALIHDAGDLPHDEQPKQTNAALLRFLERVGAGTPVRGVARITA